MEMKSLLMDNSMPPVSTSNINTQNSGEPLYDIIYICHAQKDELIAHKTIDLILNIGLQEKQIISTYISAYSTPLGENRYDYFLRMFGKKVFVVFLITNNTYNDTTCNQDMGAVWALKYDYVSMVFPSFDSAPINAIDPRQARVDMRENEVNIKSRMGELKNKIEHSFIIEKISENRWEMCRDQYISFAKNLEVRNDSNKKTAHNLNIEKVLSALGEKSLFSLDAVASLGFTKAQSQQIISDLLKEKYIRRETAGRYRWIK